ncbi:TlpA family protein disulfide reductase [Agromyces sp. MMS24-JH15]|uniref:TlpA family protein disulfide reductase n=1 Tax=Agromyces sp. MMS24-JH15 TaxID=3243765 RepID=UPI00374A44E8
MDLTAGLLAALALVALATLVGVIGRARTGRVRDASGAGIADALGLPADSLGGRATLVQFSTEFCSRCPGTADRLRELAAGYRDVTHVEIDLTGDPVLADRFHVTQTPTTLVLDATGSQVARIGGVPRQPDLRDLLDHLTGSIR